MFSFLQCRVLQPSENSRCHGRSRPLLSSRIGLVGVYHDDEHGNVLVARSPNGMGMVGGRVGDYLDWYWDVGRFGNETVDGQTDVQYGYVVALVYFPWVTDTHPRPYHSLQHDGDHHFCRVSLYYSELIRDFDSDRLVASFAKAVFSHSLKSRSSSSSAPPSPTSSATSSGLNQQPKIFKKTSSDRSIRSRPCSPCSPIPSFYPNLLHPRRILRRDRRISKKPSPRTKLRSPR